MKFSLSLAEASLHPLIILNLSCYPSIVCNGLSQPVKYGPRLVGLNAVALPINVDPCISARRALSSPLSIEIWYNFVRKETALSGINGSVELNIVKLSTKIEKPVLKTNLTSPP